MGVYLSNGFERKSRFKIGRETIVSHIPGESWCGVDLKIGIPGVQVRMLELSTFSAALWASSSGKARWRRISTGSCRPGLGSLLPVAPPSRFLFTANWPELSHVSYWYAIAEWGRVGLTGQWAQLPLRQVAWWGWHQNLGKQEQEDGKGCWSDSIVTPPGDNKSCLATSRVLS